MFVVSNKYIRLRTVFIANTFFLSNVNKENISTSTELHSTYNEYTLWRPFL